MIGMVFCEGIILVAKAVEFTLKRVLFPSTRVTAVCTTRTKSPSTTEDCLLLNNWLPVVVTQSNGPFVVRQFIAIVSFTHRGTLPDGFRITGKNRIGHLSILTEAYQTITVRDNSGKYQEKADAAN